MRAGLAGAFGQAIEAAPTSELEAVGFQNAAEDRLAQALGVPFSSANLHDARHRRDEARDTHQLLNIELAELGLRLEEHRRLATMIGAQLPEAFAERSEEHTSELQSLMRISYAVFCLKKKKTTIRKH